MKTPRWAWGIGAAALLLVFALSIAACGEEEPASVDTDSFFESLEPYEPTSTPTPTPSKTKATPKPTPTPTKTKEPSDSLVYGTVAAIAEMNNDSYNSEFKSKLFTAKTGDMKLKWNMKSAVDEYDWVIGLFRKGQTPDNSAGVGPLLFSAAGDPDSGTKKFKLTPGKQYYLWIEIWHVNAFVTVWEAR